MSKLTIKELTETKELGCESMVGVRGGLTANINNSQQADQVASGGNGLVFAFNSPVSVPSTVLTESNPVTVVDMNFFNLMNSWQNGIGA